MTLVHIALYMTAGFLLGCLYLSGLWLTVTWLKHVENPLLLLVVSTSVRLLLLLTAFALVSGFEWKRLIACMAGFVVARLAVSLWPRVQAAQGNGVS